MSVNMNLVPRVVEATFETTGPLSFAMGVFGPLTIEMTSNVVQGTGESWDGPYTITPHAYNQEFHTADKTFTDDLTVLKIPTHQSPNTKGITFTIDG